MQGMRQTITTLVLSLVLRLDKTLYIGLIEDIFSYKRVRSWFIELLIFCSISYVRVQPLWGIFGKYFLISCRKKLENRYFIRKLKSLRWLKIIFLWKSILNSLSLLKNNVNMSRDVFHDLHLIWNKLKWHIVFCLNILTSVKSRKLFNESIYFF